MSIEDIYNEYFRDVFNFALALSRDREVAGDITQEAFLRALRLVDDFDGVKDYRAWLFTVARNAYYDLCRKKRRLTDMPPETPSDGPGITEKLADKETALDIHRFIHDMAEPYKEVFTLRVFGELPYESIGVIFGKSAGWARVVYYRAKKLIQDHMEDKESGKKDM